MHRQHSQDCSFICAIYQKLALFLPPQVLDMNMKFKFICRITLLILKLASFMSLLAMLYMTHDVYMFKYYVQLFNYSGVEWGEVIQLVPCKII